jgi:ferredoxin-NADP reductase
MSSAGLIATNDSRDTSGVVLAFFVWLFAALFATGAFGQISPEEHARHHPGAAGAQQPTSAPAGMGPPAGVGPPGGMEGMGDMMKMMGGTPPKKELYPSLMNMPEFSPEKRSQVQAQADESMRAGTRLLATALDRLNQAVASNDYTAMQDATAKMREGLAQFESGVAAHRALAEGKPPRDVALQWFRSEMNLPQPAGSAAVAGPSWFHATVMATLILFAVMMIWMYFFKMRRAALLLRGLTIGAPPAPAGAPALSAPTPSTKVVAALAPILTTPTAAGKWSGKLRIGTIFQETLDVKTFRLMNPLGGVLPFSYLPGQFLTVTVPTDDKPVKRSYTIASSPTQHDYAEITVKHEEGGVVSGFLHDRVHEGHLLEFSGPTGSFIFTGRECKCILLIGGGVGITPLMSVLRYLIDRSWPGDIYFLYCISTPQDFIFREELDYLQRRHPNLRVIVTVSHPEGTDWKGPVGRITKELIAQSVPDLASRYVHVCGPVPMMEAVKKMLIDLGVPTERIKTEAFGLALGKPEPTLPLPAPASVAGAPAEQKTVQAALPTATFSVSDKSAPLPPDKAILDVADEIGVEIDNSCRVGTCGTCRLKLLSGKVTMAVEDGLEPGDKENNIILACQAKSTENVTVEA